MHTYTHMHSPERDVLQKIVHDIAWPPREMSLLAEKRVQEAGDSVRGRGGRKSQKSAHATKFSAAK